MSNTSGIAGEHTAVLFFLKKKTPWFGVSKLFPGDIS
jgi:hypothetical protein